VVVASAAVLAAVLVVTATGVAGARWGWLWTSLVFGAVAAVSFAVIVDLGRWTPHATAVVAALATVAALLVAHSAPYSHGRLRSALRDIQLGEDFRRVDTSESGAPICFDACPRVTDLYEVPRASSEAARAIEAAVRREGYEVQSWRNGSRRLSERTLRGRRGRLELSVSIVTRVNVPADGGISYTSIPAASTGVVVSLTS
jgi:hypothetical protein